MASLFIELLPLILGNIFAPLWVVIVLLMLANPRGLANASMFVLGMTTIRLAQGVIFGTILTASPYTKVEDGNQTAVVSTLQLIIGILLLITAVRKWRKEVDPEEPSPKWMQSLEHISPLKALGLGALLVTIGPKLWVFTLSALAIISAAELGLAASVATYLTYIILAQIVLIVAMFAYVVVPQAASAVLQRSLGWLTEYNRPITIVVSLVLGFYFTWDGIKGLLN